MRFAYADPPYLGCCRLYGHEHNDDGLEPWDGWCWDDPDTHAYLIDVLCHRYPDGWAMSATSGSLRTILPMCPDDVRVGSWVKPFHIYKKGVRPAYAWEPIIFWRGRNKGHRPPEKGGKATTPKDFISCNITLKKGLTGAKPRPVVDHILELLNFQPGDELVDLFPGTGIMAEAVAAR